MTGFSGFRRYGPIALLLIASSVLGTEQDRVLIVHFEGMKSDAGKLVASMWQSPAQFLSRQHEPVVFFNGSIQQRKSTWQIPGLAFGRYAISAYHDANDNGQLDSGLFAIPIEDYGFSNNARGSFGPPDFDRAAFEFEQSGQELTIRIK